MYKPILFFFTILLSGAISGCDFRNLKQLPASLLIRNDKPTKNADYIIIMMGKVIPRAEHAANLYHQGYADRIIFAEAEFDPLVDKGFLTPDGVATKMLLSALGVPEKAIIFLDKTRNSNSKDELNIILSHIRTFSPNTKRVILATSWYHSSRAHWVANRLGYDDIKIESKPTEAPPDFWQREADFLWVFQEYLKWIYYLVHY